MDQSELTRNAVKVWMREVLQTHGWKPAEWARRAETSPTNITRFLGPTSSLMPSVETLAKLCRAAGSQPNLAGLPRQVTEADHIRPAPVNFCPECGIDLRVFTPPQRRPPRAADQR